MKVHKKGSAEKHVVTKPGVGYMKYASFTK